MVAQVKNKRYNYIIMDPRVKPFSFEVMIFIVVFLFLFKYTLAFDVTNLVVAILLALSLLEMFRILYKIRAFRKAGVDISKEQYKSPVMESVSPAVGNFFSLFNRIQVYLIGIVLIVFVVLYFFFHINITDWFKS